MGAKVTLTQIGGRKSWRYQAKTGTITWNATGSDASCSWKTAGSQKATKYDLYMEIATPGSGGLKGYRASFSAQDEIKTRGTQQCSYPSQPERDVYLGHPFFTLGRITEGVPVDAKVSTIKGQKPGSQSAAGYRLSWTYEWSFSAVR